MVEEGEGVWRRRNPEIRNWDELCETKRNVLNMKFYFWLTFIASDHLISGQGGRYRPLLNRAYQSFQREAAKEIPKPPHNPNYRHGNSYNTARKLLFHQKFHRSKILLSISLWNWTGSVKLYIGTKWPFGRMTSWPSSSPWLRLDFWDHENLPHGKNIRCPLVTLKYGGILLAPFWLS